MTEGSLNLPRPATCSVLLSPLYQQVYCTKLPKIHPLKYQTWAVITAFGRLLGESEGGGKELSTGLIPSNSVLLNTKVFSSVPHSVLPGFMPLAHF